MSLAQCAGAGYQLTLGFPDETALGNGVTALVDSQFASRLAGGDATLWGTEAEPEASKRLAWVHAAATAGDLVAEVTQLRAELGARGLTRVVLCGMGGSSLAPEVICASHQVPLVVLDSTQPDFVRAALSEDLDHTVVVVASKSGGTVETDSQRRIFEAAFADHGVDPSDRIVVVTDPGSPLSESALASGYRVFHADPNVGGRYSALTAFGLVPAGLAGADLSQLVTEAQAVADALDSDSPNNPGLRLGALLGQAQQRGVDKLVLADHHSPHPGLGDWVEQLVAESTGKGGRGILPVVVEGITAPNFSPSAPDSVLVAHGKTFPFAEITPASHTGAHLDASLGAAFLIWEYATVVAGQVMQINPFDQPDVESAKAAAREMLTGSAPSPTPSLVDGSISVYGKTSVSSLVSALADLLSRIDPEHGYLAVQAYLDRYRDNALAELRPMLAAHTERPVTFGWGPRFLHSTGQLHKGGPPTGVFVQITADPDQDQPVAGREFSCQEFLLAQAIGDAHVLTERGRPVLRLHLADPSAIPTLLGAFAQVAKEQ